ncbi:MAG: transcription antitermination factor NusB [Myxococcota bacterium]
MQRPPTARALAIRVLRDLDRGGFSNRSLSRQLERHPGMDGRERGLTTVLVYGVLRHRARLDAHIDAHARKPKGLKGEVRHALRIAAFEMLELERPPAIAVSEALKGLRHAGPLKGAVQAILGAIGRDGAALDASFAEGKPLVVMERRWSIPRWLGGRWIKQLGPDAALARAKALAEPPPVDLRLDLGRITHDDAVARLHDDHPGIILQPVPDQPQALRTRSGGDLFYGPMHDEGLISVQGLAAQQAARALAPEPGMRVLDACAGMGVKTLQLAELMHRRGTLVAADNDPKQLAEAEVLRARGRLDDECLTFTHVEADLCGDHDELDAEPFDAVLLDVPCTGLGNLARHPEIRWQRSYEDIGARAQLQRALLRRNLLRVRPGGALVYAVCSFAPEEGQDVVAELLEEGLATLAHDKTWTPEGDGTEGFYIARLVRSEG